MSTRIFWEKYLITLASDALAFCIVRSSAATVLDRWVLVFHLEWWHHQMGTVSMSLALCEGNPPVTGGFPSQRPVMQKFYVFFDLHLNKRLSKPSRCQWFETPSHSLWRHCNVPTPSQCWEMIKKMQINSYVSWNQLSMRRVSIIDMRFEWRSSSIPAKPPRRNGCISCLVMATISHDVGGKWAEFYSPIDPQGLILVSIYYFSLWFNVSVSEALLWLNHTVFTFKWQYG